MKILIKWLLSAGALLVVAYLYGGVQVNSFSSAMIAALVIGLLNAVLRPILVVLTLPVTIVTVGLFLFVVNGLMFWAASGLLSGFHVAGFWAAMLGALIYSRLAGHRITSRAPVPLAAPPRHAAACPRWRLR